MKTTLITLATALLGFGLAGNCNASISLVSSVGGQPSAVANYVTFDAGTNVGNVFSNTANTDTVTVSITPDAGFVTGSASGLYAAPYLSGNNGVKFGLGAFSGQNTTQYATSGRDAGATAGAKFEIQFSSNQLYFGLLWGSVDTYNTLKFFDGATLIGTITGADVTAGATGDQGINGTFYVNMNADAAFNRVEISSSQYAFEFDNIAYSQSRFSTVPEPTSLAIWSVAGLVGLVGRRRRRV